jgi:hypothetical protein
MTEPTAHPDARRRANSDDDGHLWVSIKCDSVEEQHRLAEELRREGRFVKLAVIPKPSVSQ